MPDKHKLLEDTARDEIARELDRLEAEVHKLLTKHGLSANHRDGVFWLDRLDGKAAYEEPLDIARRAGKAATRITAALNLVTRIPELREELKDSRPTWKLCRIMQIYSALFPDPEASKHLSSWAQSARAGAARPKARKNEALKKEVEKILTQDRDLTWKQVGKKLENLNESVVIPNSGLKDVVSRVRKKLSVSR